MKPFTVFVAELIFTLAFCFAGNTSAQEQIKIASWNLDLHDFEGTELARDQTPEDLAAVIRWLETDILVLQEVQANLGAKSKRGQNSVLKQALREVPGDWEHTLLPAVGVSEAARTGIAWNTQRVELLNKSGWDVPVRSTRVTQNPDKWTWPRKPVVFHFSAGRDRTDFLVIPLHQTADIGSRDYAQIRFLEAQDLVTQLPRIKEKFRDQDIAIVGRLGQQHDEPCITVFEKAGLVDINPKDQPSMFIVNRRERRLDLSLPMARAVLSGDQTEMAEPEFAVMSPAELSEIKMTDELFYRRVSDYMPTWFTVAIEADDD